MSAFCSQTFEVRLELFDLIFQALAMRSVLRCVDGPVLEGRVFGAKRIDFPTKPAVFRFDIFPLRHVPIVARCTLIGLNIAIEPCRTPQNLVEPWRTWFETCAVRSRCMSFRTHPWLLSCAAMLLLSAPVAAQQAAEKSIPDKVQLFIPYKEYTAEDNKRVLDEYKYLRVADVSDGMDVVGLQNIGLVNPEIHALWKDTENFTHRVAGIAVTARYVPTNRREPKMDQKTINQWYSTITSEAFMKVLTPGSILVIDAMEDGESRSIGSSNIMSWKKLGMVGLVTSGGLADTDEIIYEKVPTYFRRLARGIRPGRNELESVNRPVTIGGVLVRPGDVVVADGDGVVVVPRERALEVAAAALTFLDNIGRDRYIKETGKNPWAKKPGGQ